MTSKETYNATRLSLGQVSPVALTMATHVTQAALGMDQDGMLGPATAAMLERLGEHPLVAVAMAELGRGEQGANNAGPDVARYFAEPYIQGRRYGEWCAAFVSWCALRAGVVGPEQLERRDRLGAKRLTTRLGEIHRWAVPPQHAARVRSGGDVALLAGDVICHSRGSLTSWTGHVGIVLIHHPDDSLVVIDGNSEAFPSHVRIRTYPPGGWRARLYAVARTGLAEDLAR